MVNNEEYKTKQNRNSMLQIKIQILFLNFSYNYKRQNVVPLKMFYSFF